MTDSQRAAMVRHGVTILSQLAAHGCMHGSTLLYDADFKSIVWC